MLAPRPLVSSGSGSGRRPYRSGLFFSFPGRPGDQEKILAPEGPTISRLSASFRPTGTRDYNSIAPYGALCCCLA
jgi:hypothetical protein